MKDGVLTDAAGRTLYTFDKDQTNKSNCAGGCLQAWPAYLAEASADAKLIQGLSRFDQNGVQQWSRVLPLADRQSRHRARRGTYP